MSKCIKCGNLFVNNPPDGEMCHICKIADLEAKLAEKDKAIENWEAMYRSVMQSCHNGIEEDKRLEKQLAEKDAEIEKWKSMAERSSRVLDRFNYCGESMVYNTTREQDKISFAVDKLKKLKDRLSSMQWCFTGRRNFLQEVEFMRKSQEEMIDEEIEDLLKEMK